jgi:hypothetical protein
MGGELVAVDWQVIKQEYITDPNTSYRRLAEKYGVSRVQIGNVGSEEGWVELRRKHLDKTLTKTINALGTAQAQRAARLQTVADKLLGKIEAAVDSFDMEMLFMDKQALRQITGALKDIKDIQMIKSDADLREQEARIEKLRREAEREDQSGSNEVTVTILGGAEAWQK